MDTLIPFLSRATHKTELSLCGFFLLNVNRNNENKDVSFVVPIYTQLIKKSNENSRWLPVKLSQVELKCIVFRSDEYTRSKMFRSHDHWQILSRPIKVIFFLSSQCSIFQVPVFFYFPTNLYNKIMKDLFYIQLSVKKELKKELLDAKEKPSSNMSRV